MPTVEFPLTDLNNALEVISRDLVAERKQTLEVVGISLLSHIKLAYVQKSRGGTGDDGIKWKPITVQTILGRLKKAGHIKVKKDAKQKLPASQERFRRSTYTVARTKKQNAKLFDELAKVGATFSDKKGNRITGAAAKFRTGTVIGVNSKVRKTVVNLSPGAYQIGVDTGLQLNSANPGFQGGDGDGGNVFRQDDVSVTVGFGRSYSSYFDDHRKLIPEILPDDWQKEVEELAEERGAKVVTNTLNQMGLS